MGTAVIFSADLLPALPMHVDMGPCTACNDLRGQVFLDSTANGISSGLLAYLLAQLHTHLVTWSLTLLSVPVDEIDCRGCTGLSVTL